MAKRKMPVRTATLDFADDGYPDFHCETWMNISVFYGRCYAALTPDTDDAEGDGLFLKLYPSWDFVDFDGKPIPHTVEGIAMIPKELGDAMQRRRAEALQNGAMPGPLGSESSEQPSEDERG